MSLSDELAQGWRSIGANARRKGLDLKFVLTANPKFDALIREGYDMAKASEQNDAPLTKQPSMPKGGLFDFNPKRR